MRFTTQQAKFCDLDWEILTPELQEKVRHLVNFKFKKNPRYNLDNKRLKLIEKQIQKRARILLQD